jgi:hypothetical protein
MPVVLKQLHARNCVRRVNVSETISDPADMHVIVPVRSPLSAFIHLNVTG